MRIISNNLSIGLKFLFASASYQNSKGSAKVSSSHAFLQVGGTHQTQNGLMINLKGAETVQGNLLANLTLSKSYKIDDELKFIPALGYEYVNLKSTGSKLSTAGIVVGILVEHSF